MKVDLAVGDGHGGENSAGRFGGQKNYQNRLVKNPLL